MTDSCQSSETIETTLIDVASEAEKREQIKQLFNDQSIYIPERYQTQMVKTGLLDPFIKLIEHESIRIKQIKEILNKHHINIPPQFYPQIIQTNLFESLLDIVHDVDHQTEIEQIKYFQIFYQPKKRSYDATDADENDNDIESHNRSERQTKTLKTSHDDNVSISTINH